MDKKTEELDFKLRNATNIDSFFENNATEFDDKSFYKLLNELIKESGKSKFSIATEACISEPFIYNLLKAEKRPTRDTVIKLAFGLKLSVETAERLLKLAGYSELYVRHKRDSILKFALNNGLSLMEADGLLIEYGYSIISD
ncbi:hypothetical protein [Anaerosporobacter sp.]|uniref:hypothetical protein n=1 Tax=Anaerosporobacter sp. TaxID=1872529 RepID=UPI00286EC8CF|nr:hypothetical protein [Anaerosporobacter sp.]